MITWRWSVTLVWMSVSFRNQLILSRRICLLIFTVYKFTVSNRGQQSKKEGGGGFYQERMHQFDHEERLHGPFNYVCIGLFLRQEVQELFWVMKRMKNENKVQRGVFRVLLLERDGLVPLTPSVQSQLKGLDQQTRGVPQTTAL